MNWRPTHIPLPVWMQALALMVAVLGTFFLFLARGWDLDKEQSVGQLTKLDRLRAVASYGAVLDKLTQQSSNDAFKDLFLGEGTPDVVYADMLTRLKELSATLGVEVLRADGLQSKTEGPLALVGGNIEVSGTIPAIYGFVQQIEAAKPLLFIDRLAIRGAGAPIDEQHSDTALTVEMQIYGALPNPAPPAISGEG